MSANQSDHMNKNASYQRNRGIALILVLWLVALLAIVAASLATQTKVESRLAGNAKVALQAKLLAESGFNRAIMELMVNDPQYRWKFNGQVYALKMTQGDLEVAVRNVSGLLDLNNASSEQLSRLFVLITDDQQQREALVDRLKDWRDADDLKRIHGAEDDEYRAAGYAYATAGSDLKTMQELAYIMGFNADKVDILRPYVTLHSDLSTVDSRFSSKELMALINVPSHYPAELVDALAQLDSELVDLHPYQGGGGTQSRVYRIQVDATTTQGGRASITADVELNSQGRKPYSIHSWYESL
jgi:general secretion pathway protein K